MTVNLDELVIIAPASNAWLAIFDQYFVGLIAAGSGIAGDLQAARYSKEADGIKPAHRADPKLYDILAAYDFRAHQRPDGILCPQAAPVIGIGAQHSIAIAVV